MVTSVGVSEWQLLRTRRENTGFDGSDHVMNEDDLVRAILGVRVEGRRGSGEPKLTEEQVVE